MNRRTFLQSSALTAAHGICDTYLLNAELDRGAQNFKTALPPAPNATQAGSLHAQSYNTTNTRWQSAYDHALTVLAANIRTLPRFNGPVLIEGSEYNGVWMECAPQEGLVYRKFRPDVARNNHLTFFALQREDGQLPANNKLSESGFGQIQMVVPIAATAWELAEATADSELLEIAYRSCSRWDDWLLRYRNTRGTGLIEGFCTYDTGMDNSPRWAGISPQCPNKDAKLIPSIPTLPRLCPDLSATTFGARIALAAMAGALGKPAEAEMWLERAQQIRQLLLTRLYVPGDAAFYDLDAQNHFVRIRTCVLTRLCGEHVLDQRLFDDLWDRQLGNPNAFWPLYPLPSVAVDDPHFVRPIPRNSWGGASQALTALRASRWFDHYNRSAQFSTLMDAWCEAVQRDPSLRQQIDPSTGDFSQADRPGYSPAALVMVDYTWRLSGIVEERDSLSWNLRPSHPSARQATFTLATDDHRVAELRYSADGRAELRLDRKSVAILESGTVRLVTDKRGRPTALVGIDTQPQPIRLRYPGRPQRTVVVEPNEHLSL
jgi:hypothetical protein